MSAEEIRSLIDHAGAAVFVVTVALMFIWAVFLRSDS